MLLLIACEFLNLYFVLNCIAYLILASTNYFNLKVYPYFQRTGDSYEDDIGLPHMTNIY